MVMKQIAIDMDKEIEIWTDRIWFVLVFQHIERAKRGGEENRYREKIELDRGTYRERKFESGVNLNGLKK